MHRNIPRKQLSTWNAEQKNFNFGSGKKKEKEKEKEREREEEKRREEDRGEGREREILLAEKFETIFVPRICLTLLPTQSNPTYSGHWYTTAHYTHSLVPRL